MIDESILETLRNLASSLVFADSGSPTEEWNAIAESAESLHAAFFAHDDLQTAELAHSIAEVAKTLSKGIIANPDAGVKAIQACLGALQDIESPGGINDSLRKQALAEASLFFRDAQKEKSRVEKDIVFGDEDEQREMLIAIEQRVDELESDLYALCPPVSDSEQVRSVFRQFHTLKGEGAICGIKSVADYCHGIESELEGARSGNLVLTAEVISVLQELTAIVRPILAGQSREDIGEDLIQALMDELRQAVLQAGAGGTAREDAGTGQEAGAGDDFADFFSGFAPPSEADEPDTADEDGDEEESIAAQDSPPEPDSVPAPPAAAPVAAEAGEEPVPEPAPVSDPPPPVAAPAPGPLEERKEPVERKAEEGKLKAISVDVNHLDELLELVGEVALVGSYVTAEMRGKDTLALQTANLLRACARLQEVANSMRMTPIRPLFMTVRRAAADAARASRKLVDIDMHGIDTLVDRAIVENLSAALIHIIRNAVDHGIEPAEARKRAGKPERGSIVISARRTDSDILIELRDDGKGFDLEAIRASAVAMGTIAPEAVLSPEALADLVFLPGLSTARELTGLSGRGVGMEIVRDSIDALRGRVEIRTVEGEGTSVCMRFPIMVAAMDAMLVRVGKNILAFPTSQVRECFRPAAGDISTVEGRGTIVTIRGVILPVLFMGKEFGIEARAVRPEDGVLIVVETGDMLAAVLVDETLGSTQVVIRSLEGPLMGTDLISGAAVLPDGSIGLVVETARLTERVATTASRAFNDAGRRQAETSRQVDTVSIGTNQVGIIDFSITVPDRNGGERTHVFAINAFKTREFVPLTTLRSLPGGPSGFAGLMMLRDTTVPVVHMGVVLGLLREQDRRPEWEQIVLICEFSGKTVGFLVSQVERVSYISWEDIMPPPSSDGKIQLDYVVGAILMERLKGAKTIRHGRAASGAKGADVAFVLDFERIVGSVLELYGDVGAELGDMAADRKGVVRVMLVEDSPLIRKQTAKALASAGITVIECGDGLDAWETVQLLGKEAEAAGESIFTRVDLVLSDIEMPRMDGYTLTNNIKNEPTLRVLPVLLHSSITNENMISRAREVEADGFIPKCDPRELAEQLRKYL